ncbi:hypothetical protein GCM10027277_23630 [Pseudoduganella ginsengisoli]|uniref:Uncharacterized protein n=1 Tax=Pseudoduganella ginsengisoli TaxID=1462440 RepID=A0A6L6Q0G3_9BURK|nr:hypothetical protein [Pseudoduganella ginsengisoli]MTW02914.1 hypothetical protein [Pseudoduganella ginsengisoli]
MTMKTRKKHTNQHKDTQDRPRLDSYRSQQSGRQQNTSVQPGNLSGAGSEGGDEFTISSESGQGRGNRQRGGSGNR